MENQRENDMEHNMEAEFIQRVVIQGRSGIQWTEFGRKGHVKV